MSTPDGFARAQFTPKSGSQSGQAFPVHFNPVSLQYTITNKLDEGKGGKTKQYVSQSTGKLTMDLVFDTTDTGQDVRTFTTKVAGLMQPVREPGNKPKQVPPVVEFSWGVYRFQGVVESYKETLDFFAPTGVPLRASVNLTLSRQDEVFIAQTGDPVDTGGAGGLSPDDTVDVPTGSNSDATSTAASGGDPRAGRSIAAANGLASMRSPTAGATLSVSGSISLGDPVAFTTGSVGFGAGVGVGAGFGIGASAGIGIGGGIGASAGIGISGGIGASASAGVSIGASFGASASAGVSASAGAFSGLRVQGGAGLPTVAVSSSLDTSRMLPKPPDLSLATGAGASFGLGGAARVEGSASLGADVGASASLRGRLQFDGG